MASQLGHNPLAVDAAATYIRRHQTVEAHDYLALCKNCDSTVWTDESGMPQGGSLYRSFKVTFDGLSHEAKYLLLVCGFLGYGDIWFALFKEDKNLPISNFIIDIARFRELVDEIAAFRLLGLRNMHSNNTMTSGGFPYTWFYTG